MDNVAGFFFSYFVVTTEMRPGQKKRRASLPAARSPRAPPRLSMSALAADARLVFGDVCVICQDDVTDRGRLDGCAHLFCVPCIVRWAEVETKCPLCKARFEVIYPEAYRRIGERVSDGEEAHDAAFENDAALRDDRDERRIAPRTRGRSRVTNDDPRGSSSRKPIKVTRRDQTYEDPDGDPLNGLDLDEVTCGTCGEGGDEDRLMLCDGCDAGHHCFCVGLDTVPLEEWRCRICAETNDSRARESHDAFSGGLETALVTAERTDHDLESLHAPRTVATVRARFAEPADDDEEEPSSSSPRRALSRLAARRRAADSRAARFSARRAHATTPEFFRAVSDERGEARRARGGEGVRSSNIAPTFDDSFASPRERIVGSRRRPDGGGRLRSTDARRRQMARVRELRRMWDQYRNGEMTFDGACALGADATTETASTPARARLLVTGGDDRLARRSSPNADEPGVHSPPEESDAERRRRAAAATLAAVGWSGGGGEACLANAPGRVFSGGADDGNRRESAAGRDGETKSSQRNPPSDARRLLKRARRREPQPAARRASDVFATSLGATSLGGASLSFRMTHTRSLPAALAGGASRGGASRGGGSGPDRKGAFAGVAFSPPRPGAAGDAGAGVSVPEPSGWTSSDEDEASGRPTSAAAANAKHPERNPRPPGSVTNTTKTFLASRATGFVPPGSVTHVPPAMSARDAEAARRAMLRDAEAAGAPDKARVVQMVKARLKPYYSHEKAHGSADDTGGATPGVSGERAGEKTETEGRAATDDRNRKRIRSAAQFKDLAKRASAAARAATAAAALKHGPDESADGAREEAIARAVRRAVDAALAREGIEVMKATPRE